MLDFDISSPVAPPVRQLSSFCLAVLQAPIWLLFAQHYLHHIGFAQPDCEFFDPGPGSSPIRYPSTRLVFFPGILADIP